MSQAIRITLLTIPTLLIAGYLVAHAPEVRRQLVHFGAQQGMSFGGNTLAIGSAATPGTVRVSLHPLEEFDFLPLAEIFRRRTALLRKETTLAPQTYSPSSLVFGEMEEKKPYWGINGIFLYGPGERSIEGASEESRFILNPYLLVGVIESHAFIPRSPQFTGEDVYPRPLELELNAHDRTARVRYDVTRFFRYLKHIGSWDPDSSVLNLVAYNARDLGFNFLWVDATISPGISWFGEPNTAAPIIQMLHTGGSCGFPGGCNNMSPADNRMLFSVAMLPAKISLKLWRDAPKSVRDEADMRYTIELVDAEGRFDLATQLPVESAIERRVHAK